MKAPKFATMSLDAMVKMRETLETAIKKRMKSAGKAAKRGLASLPSLTRTAKPKRKAATKRKTTARKTTTRKTTARKAPARKTAAGKSTARRATGRGAGAARKRA